MKAKRKYPANLLVSKKFYTDIIARLSTSLACDIIACAKAMAFVNSYLCGDWQAVVPQGVAGIAVNLLLPELDRALERSRRARARGKQQSSDTATAAAPQNRSQSPQTSQAEDSAKTDNGTDAVAAMPPLNRHQRRLIEKLRRQKERRDAKKLSRKV